MTKRMRRGSGLLVALALVGAACTAGSDAPDGAADGSGGTAATIEGGTIDYAALGLWDDGPCDPTKPPLVLGISSVFESPVISLGDQVFALEAAAEAFNTRGGANGSCIEVHTCDDGANLDQSLACVRQLDEAGVVAMVNELTTAGSAEVAAALTEAGIPRVATNVGPNDWGDPNAYPMDASSTGVAFLMPEGLISQGVSQIGLIRPDLAQVAVLSGILADMYPEASFPMDVAVPAGTTDFTQFILAGDEAEVGGVVLALGEQEAVQIVRAGDQLGTSMLMSASLGTFAHTTVAEMGGIAEQIVFLSSLPPITVDLPVYEVLRADLAASGKEELQPAAMKVNSARSWIGLYALLYMIREANLTEFSREAITGLLRQATDIPMLGVFGDETWTPDKNHPGLFQRAGTNHWGVYRWDPDAPAPGGLEGNFVEVDSIDFDEVLCGSPFGAPEPC